MARTRGSKVIVQVTSEASHKPETVTLKVTLPVEVKRVLQIEALGRGCSVGEVVAELVKAAPRRFVLQDRGKPSARPEAPPEDIAPTPLLVRGDAGPYLTDRPEVA